MAEESRNGMGVLLVEDNEDDIELVRRMLEKTGVDADLHVARDGEEALAVLARARGHAGMAPPGPRVILLDLRLPDVDGRELLHRIKNDPQLCSIPVVVLTGSQGEQPMMECARLGGNMYFVKPITLADAAHVFQAVRKYWMVMGAVMRRRT
jgi:CheY-like chemotaxis protein